MSDYGMGKRQYVYRGVHYILLNYNNIILDLYILCNEAVIHKYVFRSGSSVSRINCESWTMYWNFWSKWCTLNLITIIAHYRTG